MNNNRFYGMIGGIALAASALAFSATGSAAFDGFGQDIPLESAARQIVPDGWSVDFGDGVDKAAAVSWSNAKDWKAALSAAVAKKGYVAQYGSRSVVIAKGGRVAQAPDAAPRADKPSPRAEKPATRADKPISGKVADKPSSKPVAKAESAREVGGGGFVMAPIKEKAPAVAEAEKGEFKPYAGKATKDGKDVAAKPKGFTVAEGDNLRSVLDVWSQAAGWKVIWNSEFTYPIAAAATFEGDFIEATTALLKAMKESRPAINADFFRGNKVVVISNSSADEAN